MNNEILERLSNKLGVTEREVYTFLNNCNVAVDIIEQGKEETMTINVVRLIVSSWNPKEFMSNHILNCAHISSVIKILKNTKTIISSEFDIDIEEAKREYNKESVEWIASIKSDSSIKLTSSDIDKIAESKDDVIKAKKKYIELVNQKNIAISEIQSTIDYLYDLKKSVDSYCSNAHYLPSLDIATPSDTDSFAMEVGKSNIRNIRTKATIVDINED